MVSLLGSALQAGATSMVMLIVGRFIGGMAVGMLTSTIPMYASEISMPRWRGALSGLLQWFLSWGFLIAQWLGYACSFREGAFSCERPHH
jgi:MFS family permease